MTAIEWTDVTWNPVTGCDRTSPGCDNCYALRMAGRLKLMGSTHYQNDGDPRTSGPGFAVTCHPDVLEQPLRWRKPRMVFVNSMSDLFHQDVPADFITSVWSTMSRTPQHTYQVLTKRPQRMAKLVDRICWSEWEDGRGGVAYLDGIDFLDEETYLVDPEYYIGEEPLDNVWLGTSIESDQYTFRADHLRNTPAAVRFLSCEPLLGPLPSLDLTGIDWVIIGAESGPGARHMELDWAREIIGKARAAGTAVFVKQLSGGMHAVKDLDRFPPALRIREYPTTTLNP